MDQGCLDGVVGEGLLHCTEGGHEGVGDVRRVKERLWGKRQQMSWFSKIPAALEVEPSLGVGGIATQ